MKIIYICALLFAALVCRSQQRVFQYVPDVEAPPDHSFQDNLDELKARGAAPVAPWRQIGGELQCIKGPGWNDYYYSHYAKIWKQNGSRRVLADDWYEFSGKVIEIQPKGLRVQGSSPFGGDVFFLVNWPFQVGEGDFVSGVAKDAAFHSYTTVLGAGASIHSLDFGVIADAPQPTAADLQAAKDAEAQRKLEADQKRSEAQAKELKQDREAAANGDANAEYRMGCRFRDGEGVTKDLDKARVWFSAASESGNSDAKRDLKDLASK